MESKEDYRTEVQIPKIFRALATVNLLFGVILVLLVGWIFFAYGFMGFFERVAPYLNNPWLGWGSVASLAYWLFFFGYPFKQKKVPPLERDIPEWEKDLTKEL